MWIQQLLCQVRILGPLTFMGFFLEKPHLVLNVKSEKNHLVLLVKRGQKCVQNILYKKGLLSNGKKTITELIQHGGRAISQLKQPFIFMFYLNWVGGS